MYRVLSRPVAALTVVLLCVGAAALLNRAELKGDSVAPLSNNLALSAKVPDASDCKDADASPAQDIVS
jgi:hypothetical protein